MLLRELRGCGSGHDGRASNVTSGSISDKDRFEPGVARHRVFSCLHKTPLSSSGQGRQVLSLEAGVRLPGEVLSVVSSQ